MSQGGTTCRRILTWADFDNDGLVASSERVEFRSTPLVSFALCPYLGGNAVLYCNGDDVAAITAGDIKADPNLGTALPPKSDGTPGCLGITHRACALIEATNIINWVRGSQVPGLRDRTFNVRNDSGAIVRAQWKLGDVVNATPVVVGAPSTRFDVIYGDQTYATFFQRYKDRRQVAYVGANDGMLHAFNGGFFNNDDRAGPVHDHAEAARHVDRLCGLALRRQCHDLQFPLRCPAAGRGALGLPSSGPVAPTPLVDGDRL